MLSPYRSLPGPIWALAFARMVNTLGAFVRPFLALLMTDHLGYDVDTAGWVISVVGSMAVPGALIGGKIVDTRLGPGR